MQTESAASHLRIRRLRLNCLVPSDHPSPEQVSRRVADMAERNLSRTLTFALDRTFSENDQSLWFIKRLDFAVDVNMAWEAEDLSRCMAVRAAQTLAVEFSSVVAGSNVVRFSSPAEYLATFLTDLAQGRAWGTWYYDRFDGLRLLPTSAALRTAICNEATVALVAFHHMALPTLKQIVLEMTDSDAERVLQALADEATTGSQEDAYETAMLSVKELTGAVIAQFSYAKAALLLYVDATRAAGSQNDSQMAEAAQTIVWLIQCIEEKPVSERRRLFAALNQRDMALLYQAVGPARAEQLTPLLRLSGTVVKQILEAVVEDQVPADNGGVSPEVRTTAFGGAFFLLPLLGELPIAEAVQSLPDADGLTPEAIIRWLVLVKCFSQTNSKALARDSLIQELAGVPSSFLSRERLVRWQRKITVKQIDRLLAEITRWRWQNQTVSGTVCVLATIETKGQRLAVMLDASRGCWLFSVRLSSSEGKLLSHAFAQLPFTPEVLLCDRLYQPMIQNLLAQTTVTDLKDDSAIEKSVPTELARPVSASLLRIYEQISYLALPTEFGIASRLDRAVTVIAQGLLRDFAWRLPGFAWSQPGYLSQNFLDCEATVEEEAGRRVVRLGRPPLDLLLNMTGLNRRQYELSWLEGQRFELYPEHV